MTSRKAPISAPTNRTDDPEESFSEKVFDFFEPDTFIRRARKLFILLFGMTVLIIGLAMIVLPGPAILVIPLGLTILATEYLWARRWLNKIKEKVQALKHALERKVRP
jgi:hypothetical protein